MADPRRLITLALACTTTSLAVNADNFQNQTFQNQTFQNQTRIRQLEVDQRMNQIQQDMNSAMLNSSSTQRVFSPSLPGYGSPPRMPSNRTINPSQTEAYLEGLGDPDAGTGIYAHPPEERLYQYGLMCIEVGFVNEGVRAITEHLLISAEKN